MSDWLGEWEGAGFGGRRYAEGGEELDPRNNRRMARRGDRWLDVCHRNCPNVVGCSMDCPLKPPKRQKIVRPEVMPPVVDVSPAGCQTRGVRSLAPRVARFTWSVARRVVGLFRSPATRLAHSRNQSKDDQS